ncbi:hypothetical protein F2P81_004028 [Scophthalmus maximus]|uniref:Uncharacterized protein n=1 Tax=Scophthalmus maximus TaxID=52904 RepID=A0A6A4TIJ1_SCOMX|nr:hypothetical protein F2P81_004028 [Scophthalmus maximus]
MKRELMLEDKTNLWQICTLSPGPALICRPGGVGIDPRRSTFVTITSRVYGLMLDTSHSQAPLQVTVGHCRGGVTRGGSVSTASLGDRTGEQQNVAPRETSLNTSGQRDVVRDSPTAARLPRGQNRVRRLLHHELSRTEEDDAHESFRISSTYFSFQKNMVK